MRILRQTICAGVMMITMSLLWCSVSYAQGDVVEELIRSYKVQIRSMEIKMLESRQVLKDTDPADWTTAQQEIYLNNSLWVVYYGMLTYGIDGHFHIPTDLNELVDLGYIQEWPQNPYNDWEPIQVLDAGDGFSPGDLCLLVAPPGHRDGKGKLSSELCIFGPDVEFAQHGQVEPIDMNEEWAVIPEGVLYMLGIG